MNKILASALVMSAVGVAYHAQAVTGVQPATVQPATKIGYISASSVLSDSELGKKLKKELDDKYEKIAKELREMEEGIVRKGTELQAKKGTLSEQAFEAEQSKAKELVRKYESLRQERAEDFKTAEMKANERLVKETLEVAATIGKQGGYDAIVDKDSGRVLWTAEAVDCTKDLLAGLDKKYRAETTKVASAPTKKSA